MPDEDTYGFELDIAFGLLLDVDFGKDVEV